MPSRLQASKRVAEAACSARAALRARILPAATDHPYAQAQGTLSIERALDDGDLMALRFREWKIAFMEQNAEVNSKLTIGATENVASGQGRRHDVSGLRTVSSGFCHGWPCCR